MTKQLELPALIAHRGASAYAPENTLVAFEKAHQLGIKWVEFDIKLSKCGEIIVFHDSTLDRTTNGRGAVADLSLNDIQALDAGAWFASEFAGEAVPTLRQVIQHLAKWGMCANIEIKPCNGKDEQTTEALIQFIENEWPEGMPLPLISSLSSVALRYLRKKIPSANLALIAHRWPNDWFDLHSELQFYSIHLHHRSLNAERVSLLHSHGLKVLAYTINHQRRATQLFRWGVNAIFSDRPDKINCSEKAAS